MGFDDFDEDEYDYFTEELLMLIGVEKISIE